MRHRLPAARPHATPPRASALPALALLLLAAPGPRAQAEPITVAIDASARKPISTDLIGLFFEDINYSADGGLYAEQVQNRSFEYQATEQITWNNFTAWRVERRGEASNGNVAIDDAQPLHPNNPHSVVINARNAAEGFGISNDGFAGIPVQAGAFYDASFFARQCHMENPWDRRHSIAGKPMPVSVRLETTDGKLLGEAKLDVAGGAWRKYSARIQAAGEAADARLVLLLHKVGAVGLDEISLFPRETFRGRANGLRADLAQVLADLKPRFVRFPGGCVAHGSGLGNIYRWKDTIGPVEQRRGQRNIWGYHQSMGLGYFEYFQFCEDIGAKPLPVLAAGVSCQNSAHTPLRGQQCIPRAEMDAYIQDVLDLIEWANGPADSPWGSKRAAAGHPAPFGLQYLGIGNEDRITPEFEERFKLIHAAVRARHPEITVIGTVGPDPAGEDYDRGWALARSLGLAMVDEHYYRPPEWFWENVGRYDTYDRRAARVYVGEYATWGNTLANALAEAAMLTGFERNGDIVHLASYAPLLARHGHVQWKPDLIFFDQQKVQPTINYHVQRIFSLQAGDHALQTTISGVTGSTRFAVSAVIDSVRGDLIVKVVNGSDTDRVFRLDVTGSDRLPSGVERTVLAGPGDRATNAEEVKPVTSRMPWPADHRFAVPPYSLTVLRCSGP